MKFSFKITKAHLRVSSAVFSNFVVLWLGAVFATRDIFALTTNILLAIVSLWLSIKSEEILQKYD